MVKPVRLRLGRNKGFDLQAISKETNGLEAVYVARPSAWGNPYSIQKGASWFVEGPGLPYERCGNEEGARQKVIKLFRQRMECVDVSELRGKNLACWCKPDEACHADVLLELANK